MGCSSSITTPAWVLTIGFSPSQIVSSWVPHGSQVLPENLFLHGILSTGSSSCKEPALAWDLHGLQLTSGHIHLLQLGVLHRLQGGYLLWCGAPWAIGGQPASPWCTPGAAEESLLLPCLLHWPWCLQGCLFHISLSQLLLHSVFYLFLNMLL